MLACSPSVHRCRGNSVVMTRTQATKTVTVNTLSYVGQKKLLQLQLRTHGSVDETLDIRHHVPVYQQG